MKFRTQLIAGFVIFALLLGIISGFVIVTDQQVNKLAAQEAIASNIALEVGELGYLSNDYILYREPQQAGRWNAKFTSISEEIGSLSVDPPEQQAIVGNLAANLKNSKSVFDDIASSPVRSGSADTSYIQLSWSRMAVQNQGMIFDAGRLADLIHGQAEGVKQTKLFLVFSLMGVFVALLLISYFLFYRRMLRSLGEIQQGAAIVGSGNLTYTLKESSDDEIGDLSRSFNRMTADLRRVTASKTELEQEVAGRKKAEEELIRKNEDLGAAYEEIASTQEELRQNIDELTLAEKTLRESEDRFRTIAETLPVLISLTRTGDSTILFTNTAYNEAFGFRSGEIIGRKGPDVYYDTAERERMLAAIREKGFVSNYRLKAKRSDGSPLWLLSSVRPILYDGKPAIIGASIDIMDLVRAEEKMSGLAAIVESSDDAIIGKTLDGIITSWNAGAEQIYDYTAEEAIGRNISFLVPPEKTDDIEFVLGKINRGESFVHYETQRTKKDGTLIQVSLTMSPIRDNAGKLVGASTIARDITNRKKVEEERTLLSAEVANQAAALDATISSMATGLIVYDPDGKAVRMNAIAQELFRPELFFSMTVEERSRVIPWERENGQPFPPEEIPVARALRGETTHDVVIAAPLHGRKVWISASAAPIITPDGKMLGAVASFVDISESKRMEQELQATLQRFYLILSGMSYGILLVTHENRVEFVNRSFCDFFGLDESPSYLSGLTAAEILEKIRPAYRDPDAALTRIREIVRLGESVRGEDVPMRSGRTFLRDFMLVRVGQRVYGRLWIHVDITDRKRAEEALHESEEKFRILFTRMVEGSALHELVYSASGDPVDYRILDINPSFEHILGLKREDVIGKTSTEAYSVDEPPYFDTYRRVAETGQPEEFEVFFAPMKKHFAISAYSPEHGKFATIFTDITERKNAEQNIRTLLGEVQREKDRLSSLINSISDEVWFADTQKNFTLANPAALKEFALDNDSVDIEKFAASLEVYRPDGSPRPIEEAPPLRALKGEEVRNFEEMVRTPGTGEVRYRQVNSNPVRDTSGNIIGAVSVVRDITARRQAEEALSEIEERFGLALRNAPVSVALQDIDLIYRWAYNQTTRRTDEIIGMTDAALFAKEDVEWLTPLKQRILRTGEDAHTENWLTSNGRRVYLDLYFEPLRNKGGEITGIGIAAVNLTDLKLAKEELLMKNIDLNALNEELAATQEELEQNVDDLNRNEEVLRQNEDRLKQALAEKEVLLSEIHHRVKNNLTAFISLLSLEGSTEETPGGLALKKDLQNRARSMALIHETLYRTHKFDDVDMGVYLSTLVEQIVNSYSSPQTVRITVEADGILLDLSRATPTGLIINEIVTNSLKYAFPEGVASCRSDPDDPCMIRITLTKTAGIYTLIVMDNGIGLPPGFELSKTKTLGLKLVNFLAKHQIGAEIEVNTTKGTEFIFRFRE